jgi:hypothetical protein
MITSYILFMCFNVHSGQVCSTASFPDLAQCQHSKKIVELKVRSSSHFWCQEVRNFQKDYPKNKDR